MSYSPMLLSGVTTQRQWLTITYLEDYTDNIDKLAAAVNIEILSTYIQIYTAKLQIHPQLFGMRSLIYHHPWGASFIGVVSSLFVNIFCFIFIKFNLASFLMRRKYQLDVEDDKTVEEEESKEESEDEKKNN